MQLTKWDKRFLELAGLVSTWSKDPRGGVGAVIVSPDNRVLSVGFNGFPRGVDDRQSELYGQRVVLHAEENAILFARQDLTGCTLYTNPLPTCPTCASRVLQVKLTRVVSKYPRTLVDSRDWPQFQLAWRNLEAGGVAALRYEG